MRIGSVERLRTVTQGARPQPSAASFGAGVGTALKSLAGALENAAVSEAQLIADMRERELKKKNQQRDVEFIRRRGEATRMLQEAERNVEPGADGFTEQAQQIVQEQFEPFLAGIDDPDSRAKYERQIAQFDESATTAAFTFEYEETNRAFGEQLDGLVDEARVRLREEPALLEQELDELVDLIAESTLPPIAQEEAIDSIITTFQSDVFQRELELAQTRSEPVRQSDGTDIVAPGVTPFKRAGLNAIASPESGGRYDVMYGGRTFDDYSDHPRVYTTITSGPNKGKKSSAAGRYQFLASTWDAARASYNAAHPDQPVNDFRPVSQDRVAAHWMEVIYNRRNTGGPSFAEIQENPSVFALAHMREVIGEEWEGWKERPGHSEEKLNREFIAMMTGEQGIAGGGTASVEGPDVWNDERFADIPFDQRVTLSNAADKARAEAAQAAAEAAKEQRAAALEQATRSAFEGELNMSAVPAISEQLNLSVKEQKALRKQVEDASERAANATQTRAAAANGETRTLDRHGEGRDELFRVTGVTEQLAQADIAAINAARPTWLDDGFIPPQQRGILQSQLSANDPSTRAFALSSLAALHADNADILAKSKFTDAERGEIEYFAANRAFFGANEAGDLALLEQMNKRKDALLGKQFSVVGQEANDFFDSTFETSADLVNLWATLNPLDTDPAMPRTASQRDLLTSSMRRAYVQGYRRTGDPEQAKKYMETWAKEHWGVTRFSGEPVLMQEPPENVWRSEYPDGNLDPALDQLRMELDLAEGDTVSLVADSVTMADIAANERNRLTRDWTKADDRVDTGRAELPRYQVIVQDANGIIKQAGEHFYPVPDTTQAEKARRTGTLARAEAQAAEARQQVLALEERSAFAASPEERAAAETELESARAALEQATSAVQEAEPAVEAIDDPAQLGQTFFEQIDRENITMLSSTRFNQVLRYLELTAAGSKPLPEGMNAIEVDRLIADLRRER